MVSVQSINSKLQKHQQDSPRERAAVSLRNADSELSTTKIVATRSKKLGPVKKMTVSDGINPINQYQAPKAPTGLSKGKSGRVIKKCRL